MDTQSIREQMPTLVRGHVPSNARRFQFAIYDGQPKRSTLGFYVDPNPFDGTVVATTRDAIIVKTGRTQFAVLDRQLVTVAPDDGAKIHVEPYARRRFDGLRADTPEVQTRNLSDGTSYTSKTYILGSAPAKLPVPSPDCPELADLISQLEQLPAPDGFRRITHMLVDAGARDFTVVDPSPANIIVTPPTIGFSVTTAKFCGQVAILYDRGRDTYVVELHRGAERIECIDDVYFDDLGAVLERLIDDGSWRQIKVCVVDKKQTRQRQAPAA